MTHINKLNKRSDMTGKRLVNQDDPPIGAHNDDFLFIVPTDKAGTWRVDIERPSCPDCGSEEVRYDEHGDRLCRNCFLVVSSTPMFVRDKISANQVTQNHE